MRIKLAGKYYLKKIILPVILAILISCELKR